ncbi:unnamed protein product [Linum tenue]|uniref:Uncharacterized protein n=1 Tax=Linum tenue TaxID=586396 RepID=A0AAV0PJB3_9ROSI|nr:unnamed protein product [Linum tenue]
MCGNSVGCKAFRCMLYIVVMIVCIAYLVVVTVITLRYGPNAQPLEIRVPPVAVELDLSDETMPWLSFVNRSTIRFVNRKDHLNITIRRVEALFMYAGLPVTCMIQTKPVQLPGRSVGGVELEAVMCDSGGKYTHGPFPYTESMASEARGKGRLRLGVTMNVRAGYSHQPWGWDVLLQPECGELAIRIADSGRVISSSNNNTDENNDNNNNKNNDNVFFGTGRLNCVVTDPLWVR